MHSESDPQMGMVLDVEGIVMLAWFIYTLILIGWAFSGG